MSLETCIRRVITGEIQATLWFLAAQHNIVSGVEMVGIQDVNAAYERLEKNDVRYRLVIDMASMRELAN
jgi:D-arabinose 1-dehydrogenase-like Zn-dependent alcohol dehydrogenase